jgi:hypothetical protein
MRNRRVQTPIRPIPLISIANHTPFVLYHRLQKLRWSIRVLLVKSSSIMNTIHGGSPSPTLPMNRAIQHNVYSTLSHDTQ